VSGFDLIFCALVLVGVAAADRISPLSRARHDRRKLRKALENLLEESECSGCADLPQPCAWCKAEHTLDITE
jgi:hypothetical protein